MDRLFHLRNIRKLKDHHHQSEMLLLLNSITKFTADKSTCHQRAIATFFGEDAGEQCNICDNCQRTVQQQTQDLTEDAKYLPLRTPDHVIMADHSQPWFNHGRQCYSRRH